MTQPTRQLITSAPRRIETPLGWHYEDLSDFEFKLVVRGRPFVLKNSKIVSTLVTRAKPGVRTRKFCPGCRLPLQVIPQVLPSQQAKAYLEDATLELRAQWSAIFREPIREDVEVNAAIRTYRATLHKADASNLYQAPEDALQHAGVVVDDYQVRTHNGSDRLHDAVSPRVEITLTPYRG